MHVLLVHFLSHHWVQQVRVKKGRGPRHPEGGRGREWWDVEAEVAASKRDGGDTSHDRLSLDVEVAVQLAGSKWRWPIKTPTSW